jgi:hypothetical protein
MAILIKSQTASPYFLDVGLMIITLISRSASKNKGPQVHIQGHLSSKALFKQDFYLIWTTFDSPTGLGITKALFVATMLAGIHS